MPRTTRVVAQVSNLLFRRFPEGRKKYRQRVRALATNLLQGPAITDRLERLGLQARRTVGLNGYGEGALPTQAKGAERLSEWEAAFAAYKRQVAQRIDSVHAQLALPEPQPLTFDRAGTALISGWRPQRDWQSADLVRTNEDGRDVLRIRANGASAGSWRARLFLEPGQYRFDAEVKTRGVVALRDSHPAGAGLRLSGSQRRNEAVGDQNWITVAHEFSV